MARIKIITDSAADLPPSVVQQYNIEVVPTVVQVDGHSYRAGVDISTEQFYHLLDDAPRVVAAEPPTPEYFEQLYRRFAADHDYIFSIHMSSRLSGVYHAASQARGRLPATLTRVEVIDSRSMSMAQGRVVIAAAQAAQAGGTPDDIRQLVNTVKQHSHLVFFVDTLDYMEQDPRLSLNTAVLGSIQRIKPLMLVDDGEIVPYERTRTRAKAIEGLYTFIEDFPNVEEVFVMHTNTLDDVDRLLEKVELIFPRERIQIAQFGPSVAVHLGMHAMGVAVFEGIEPD